ncbi:MAG: hypothetical protein V4584_05145 [Verrucomicrobiota bacterium]
MSGSPSNQLFRRIAPAQAEGRLQNGLAQGLTGGQKDEDGMKCQSAKRSAHARSFGFFRPLRKAGSLCGGFVMLEAMISLSVLTVVGLVLLKLSLNILAPRQWIVQQSVTDAYMTYERAYAERVPFESLLAANSPWPDFAKDNPRTSVTTVEVGRLPRILPDFPNGVPILGTVTRTRFADPENFPADGGVGSVDDAKLRNPTSMKIWRVQSVLTYTVGGRTYAKSRTVLRSQ